MSVSTIMSTRTFKVSKEQIDYFLIEFAENKIKINNFLKQVNALFNEVEQQGEEVGLIEISQECFDELKEAQVSSDIFEIFVNNLNNLVGLLLEKPVKISEELKTLEIKIRTLKELNGLNGLEI